MVRITCFFLLAALALSVMAQESYDSLRKVSQVTEGCGSGNSGS